MRNLLIIAPKIQEALDHVWLTGKNASDRNLLPEIKAYMARARLRRGIDMVKLANRIEALKKQEEDPDNTDIPDDATLAADQSRCQSAFPAGSSSSTSPGEKRSLSKTIKGAIFREVVMAKVREMKREQESIKVQEEAERKMTMKE